MKFLKYSIIIISIISIVSVPFICNKTYANNELTLTLQTNTDKYAIGDEIKLTIKLNQKVMTASFFINYNSSAVSYKKTSDETSNLSVKDFPNDNILRSVCVDYSGIGTDEMTVTFVLNSASDTEISFFLTNAKFVTATDKKVYSNDQVNGIQNKANIQLKSNISNNPTTTPTAKPSTQPSSTPTVQPSVKPSTSPTVQTSTKPSTTPTVQPSIRPTTGTSSQSGGNGQNNTGNDNSGSIANKWAGTDTTITQNNLPQTGSNDYIIISIMVALVAIAIYFGCYFIKLKKYIM